MDRIDLVPPPVVHRKEGLIVHVSLPRHCVLPAFLVRRVSPLDQVEHHKEHPHEQLRYSLVQRSLLSLFLSCRLPVLPVQIAVGGMSPLFLLPHRSILFLLVDCPLFPIAVDLLLGELAEVLVSLRDFYEVLTIFFELLF